MSFIFLCLELVLLAILRLAGMEEIPDALAAALILVYSVAYAAGLSNKPHCRKFVPALITGYLLRIALLLFDLYGRGIYSLPNSGADTEMFYYSAVDFARGGSTFWAFTTLMGYFFRYFGINRLYAQFLLMMCSVESLECAAKCFDLMKLDDRKSTVAMWILNVLPNFAILSVIFNRESLVTVFISLSLVQYLKWFKYKFELSFIFAIALTFGGMYFHAGSIAVPVGYLLSRILYDNKKEQIRLSAKNIILTSLILLIGVFILNRYGDMFLAKFNRLETLENVANTGTKANSSYTQYVGNSNTPLNMIIYTIPRMFFFLFSPMPWMIRGLSDIIAFLFSSCFYILTTIQTFRFLYNGKKENRNLVIVIFIICLCAAFVFGWGVSNAGSACRHRDKMTIVWGILLGLTMKMGSVNNKNMRIK